MFYLKYICLSILVLIISLISFLFYCYKDIESTAKLVAMARHCALSSLNPNYTIDDTFNLGIDNYAYHFLDKESINSTCKIIAYFSTDTANQMSQRTYYFDKQIIYNLEDTKQIVILGAGYDTRSKRFEKYFQNIKIFEVDLKHTQAKKRQVTDKLNWPSNVQFVETDFNNDHLKKDLESEGYNPKLKTIFLLEGNTTYLYLYYRCCLLYSKRIFYTNSFIYSRK